MTEKTVTVAAGENAHPSALLVQTASKFKSSIMVRIENKTVNAKSIMGIISLGLLDGMEITICADGEDEGSAIVELTNFLTNDYCVTTL